MENSQECYYCVLVSPLLFMCGGITITFNFPYLYSPLFSEFFTLSKNSFGHPNTRQWNYFHLEKKMLYQDDFLFANNKTLIPVGKQLCATLGNLVEMNLHFLLNDSSRINIQGFC